jgi:phospholipid/cholesterol/gamma-HCH transport system substrate-binding protein
MKTNKAMVIKVVIFSVIASIMTVALGVKLANSRLFAKTYVISAAFEDATGVLKGDAVKLAGVDVGRVEGTEIRDGKAIVTFNIDDHIELPTDSTVAIRWRNVLGQRFLYVYPGSNDEVFPAEETIPDENTEDVNDIGTFLNRVGPILQAIDPKQANAFLDAINTALVGNEHQVRQLLSEGAKLGQALGQEDDEIERLISSADTIMAAYAGQEGAIGEIFDDLDRVGTVLARRTDDINTFVTDFARVQNQLDELVTDSSDDFDATIESLRTVTRVLANNKDKLDDTLLTLPLGVAGYFQTSSWGEFFNVRITKILVKDQDSNILVEQNELDNQHGSKGGSPAVGQGANNGYEKDEDGDDREPKGNGKKGDDEGKRSDDEQRQQQPSEGLEAILRFLLTGARL